MLTRTEVAFGILFATVVYEQYRWLKFRKGYIHAVELLEIEANTNAYLLQLFNKYDVPVDEFEIIALRYHHVHMQFVDEE